MWISKKMWDLLEQRVADLEQKVQSQQGFDPEDSKNLLIDCLQRIQSKATHGNVPKSS